ncbi:MAG: folylpolyglutamate synthase/dihydrofolate synthase family protein [Pseudomonadota bacterium]
MSQVIQNSDVILDRLLELHPKIIDLTLDRMWRLLSAVGDPQDTLPNTIHVAGTNGKGSTLAMIRAGLEGAGASTNVYTSPHLVRFHERIRLHGTLIAEEDLTTLLAECEAANGSDAITFFEITTVAALLAMARQPADYTLLEVGLGGRLDATNVMTPRITAITPISIDHQQYLGETIAEIAAEKAGILKPGVPCIVAPQTDAARDVIETKAAEIGAPLLIGGQDWQSREERGRLVFEDENGLLDLPLPRLMGSHQVVNAGSAVAVLRALDHGDAEAAATKADWPARMQRLRAGPMVDQLPEGAELWLDGGHNAAAGQALADLLAQVEAKAPAPLWLIAGMLETKSAIDYLRPFAKMADGLRCVAIPDAPASFTANDLASAAREAGHEARAAESIGAAFTEILMKAERPRIVICGSLYLAGVILRDHG